MGGFSGLWVLGFIASIAFFIVSIIDYRKGIKTKSTVILSGILTFILGMPIALFLILLIGLSSGLVGM